MKELWSWTECSRGLQHYALISRVWAMIGILGTSLTINIIVVAPIGFISDGGVGVSVKGKRA